jgi:hypothetical protein
LGKTSLTSKNFLFFSKPTKPLTSTYPFSTLSKPSIVLEGSTSAHRVDNKALAWPSPARSAQLHVQTLSGEQKDGQ